MAVGTMLVAVLAACVSMVSPGTPMRASTPSRASARTPNSTRRRRSSQRSSFSALVNAWESSARSVVVRPVRKPWRRLAAAATAIGPDSPDGELHACRILAKRARYAAEAVVAIHGRDARRFARRYRSIHANFVRAEPQAAVPP